MLWQHCLQQLEHEFPHQEINTWLRSLYAVEQEGALYLLAPNPIVLQQIHDNYLPRIVYHVRLLSGNQNFDVMLQIGSRQTAIPQAPEKANIAVTLPSNTLPNHASNSDNLASNQTKTEAIVTASSANQTVTPLNTDRFISSLNSKMTFYNYVEGKSNQLACAAAQQVSENPGKSYNPLFIYGGVGLGKTHLMHAIGNKILEYKADARVIYVYAERFVNDMINGLRTSRIEDFKQYYRSADALLIDDIQFFANKERSMEEFFHTFNALLEHQKQIIIASDRFPGDVEGIDDRLRSRFGWGLTVSVEPPDLETRVAILRKKAEDSQLIIPSDAAFFIAKRFRTNIRDLEGALQRVIASMRLRCVHTLTLEFVESALRDQIAHFDKLVSVTNIKKVVAQYYNIRVADLDSQQRNRVIARPRQIAMALAKELTTSSLPEIGQEFGGRDHTTVLHATRKVAELKEGDSQIEEDYRILVKLLTN
ncbi:chromosomal replication initiator protein DnaA [Thiofilum flexile]|uniref:chromosomal replication initiator protein DnaA n=1 Tax=Thiofilum flexile TaxID=125627 RepID=UPI000377E8CB|nr:chromosomal replication initiator protein DnaA [Thiofilum flexile]